MSAGEEDFMETLYILTRIVCESVSDHHNEIANSVQIDP